MRIQFEIKEKLPELIEEILHSDKWQTSVKEEISGRTTVVIRDQAYGSEATIEIYAQSIEIKTAWSKYFYRIFVANDLVWCEYNGAYRGLLEQVLLPTITPKESLLDSDVTESSLYGREHKKLREYAEDNLKLKQFRRENFNEQRNGTADFGLQYTYKLDHYRSVVAGVVYGYSQDLMQDNDHAVSSSSSSGNIEEKGKKYRTCLPQFIGFGASYTTLRWMASIDYKFVDWSRLESSHSSISFRNQHRLMLGGSYTLGNPYSKPVRLLLGAGMGNSYISVHDKTTTNYYLSTGLNFEFRSRSTLSLGVKYTDQLKVNSGRFKEQKLSFFLNLTFSEKTYKAKLK